MLPDMKSTVIVNYFSVGSETLTMGGSSFSQPLDLDPGLGYVCICLREPNSVLLFHAPPEVTAMTRQVINEVMMMAGDKSGQVREMKRYGVLQFSVFYFTLGRKQGLWASCSL